MMENKPYFVGDTYGFSRITGKGGGYFMLFLCNFSEIVSPQKFLIFEIPAKWSPQINLLE